jgi:hypothetical protein
VLVFMLRILFELVALAVEVSLLRVSLGADRHVLPCGHRHRSSDQTRDSGGQYATASGLRSCYTEDEACGRDDAVVGA